MYKTDVVNKAIEGLKQGGMPHPEIFQVLLERVYDCGYNEARRIICDNPYPNGCRVCGIGGDGVAYGYVCNRSDCPTRITYTS
jgi:hypothetical protein